LQDLDLEGLSLVEAGEERAGGRQAGTSIAVGKIFSRNDQPQQSAIPQWLGMLLQLLPYLVIAVGLVWRYGAANLSWRDRVVAEPPNP